MISLTMEHGLTDQEAIGQLQTKLDGLRAARTAKAAEAGGAGGRVGGRGGGGAMSTEAQSVRILDELSSSGVVNSQQEQVPALQEKYIRLIVGDKKGLTWQRYQHYYGAL